MKAHQLILQRVGTTLILIGVIEIYLPIWQFVSTTTYSLDEYWPALLVFLPIAFAWGGMVFMAPGILLFRGGLRTAKYVRYLALFGLAGDALYLLLQPILQPLDYQLLLLRLTPGTLTLDLWQSLVYIAFGFWLQCLLGRPEIANAQIDARITPASTAPPLWIGAACALGVMGMMYWGLHGENANKAIRLVKDKLGNNYDYFASSIHWELSENLKVNVVVIGYNSKEIKSVNVSWIEDSSETSN